MINLITYLNKTILVCIPSVFEDGQPRPFKLIGIELFGLWLESEELAQRLQPQRREDSSAANYAVLFPFAQISYIVDRVEAISHGDAPAAHAIAEKA